MVIAGLPLLFSFCAFNLVNHIFICSPKHMIICFPCVMKTSHELIPKRQLSLKAEVKSQAENQFGTMVKNSRLETGRLWVLVLFWAQSQLGELGPATLSEPQEEGNSNPFMESCPEKGVVHTMARTDSKGQKEKGGIGWGNNFF